MKINQQIILRAFLGLSVAGLLNGCTMLRDNMVKSTTDYNLVVEKAQNEMLLLNIVRASKRRPMYFTSMGAFRGKMNYSFQTGGSIPIGKIGTGLNGSYSITPSITYGGTPEFDLTVQDSKEFTSGIMTPVPMKTIEYYWQQGWPKEMLLNLFIYRIVIKDANGKPKETLTNYPIDQNDFNNFKNGIEAVDWDIIEVNVPGTTIGEVNENEASQLKELIEVQKAGLILMRDKEKNKEKLCLSHTEYVFTRMDPNDPNSKTEFPADSQSGNIGDKSSNKVYLRSPEAILYYLGELVRVGNRDPNISKINFRDKQRLLHPVKLFCARKATANDKAPCVSVDYEGVRYVIPQVSDSNDGYCTDRSMHVLSLVSQLIGLQRESKEAPVTGVVSVIGQ